MKKTATAIRGILLESLGAAVLIFLFLSTRISTGDLETADRQPSRTKPAVSQFDGDGFQPDSGSSPDFELPFHPPVN